jgi:voltage-gated potassium channel
MSLIVKTLIRATFTTVSLVLVYYAAPLQDRITHYTAVILPLGLLAFAALTYRGIRAISDSQTPKIKLVEVLATVVPLFVVVFASTYYVLSTRAHSSFSAPLTRTDSLYFTLTVLSTLGFGDLVPVSESARIIVMLQIVGDIVIIGAGVRVLAGAVARGSRLHEGRDE